MGTRFFVHLAVPVFSIVFLAAREGGESMEKHLTPQVSKRAERAEHSTRHWTEGVLAKRYLPPKGIRFVMVPHKTRDDCDSAVIRFVAEDSDITVTHVEFLMSVQVIRADWERAAPTLEELQTCARELLAHAESLQLALDPKAPAGARFGTTTLSAKDKERAPWLESLNWRYDEGRLVLWFRKNPGAPTMAVLNFSFEGNRCWFTPRERKGE